jgi:type I restriction enzyme S subunit
MNGPLLNSMVVGLPCIEEQETIVDKINYMMNLCDELQNEIKLNKEYSDMLMEAVLKESFDKESV